MPFQTPFPDINGVQKEFLELYMKKLGPFSSFMHDFPFGQEEAKGIKNEFSIRGPFVKQYRNKTNRGQELEWRIIKKGQWL